MNLTQIEKAPNPAAAPEAAIHTTLGDARLQRAIYASTGRLLEARRTAIAGELLPNYQELRQKAADLKRHTMAHLDHYLLQLEEQVTAKGGKVIFARTGEEVADFILSLVRQHGVEMLVKSKSMTSEEIHLNEALERHHLETVETDLGEYIIQLAGQKPFHIVAPSLHMTRYDVANLFQEKLGIGYEEVPENQTMIARRVLREKFLQAGIGITGANFLVADSGAVVIVENEGNARLSSTAPKIHIAVAGIEKVIPRAQDLSVFLNLLGRSATGQALTVYTSILSGPRRAEHLDGPEEFYLVLLDAGRSQLLADESKRESLHCIRCGACLNHCPVYRKIGGHNYPWVYSGPIGKIISPQFQGLQKDPWLPHASSLCGACGEVCPVKIDIPRILLELRKEIAETGALGPASIWQRRAFQAWAFTMRHPKLYEFGGLMAGTFLGGGDNGKGWLSSVPSPLDSGPAAAWLSQRHLPAPAAKSFRQLWREHRRQKAEMGGAGSLKNGALMNGTLMNGTEANGEEASREKA